ncbi:DUF445 domain-containing protein [Thiomicrorhabdus sp.]|uniref:DUF445 domain-containing protein n=1 Tax=Thiomicrorhabdus sp. TaxID=2039724 RepID=UPI0029C826EC|nr:DUF445 domain-containing protein [Thiomicrorhabdus sp.]
MRNTSFLVTFVALSLAVVGLVIDLKWLWLVGLFALSGAVTNWLAIHMLFEKVPGLIGSGVITARFAEFKTAIKNLMMEQFFNEDNIDRFVAQSTHRPSFNLQPVIESVDLTPAFDRLTQVIMESSFGSVLSMFGGADALQPLKEPFIKNMQASLIEMTEDERFHERLQAQVDRPDVMADIRSQVEEIIDSRLSELTPHAVKVMVKLLIEEHLGWLVIWGAVFGAFFGLLSALLIGG